ncbi:polynucleotide 5'-hydroxyl-kinase NOL9-like [Phragmites australis]|uniref:polynucleotide 5'-hydroxyl-kinase NOL9-like n=1 Tax=Phragmites australis TaxID=29695 RepID=UPI002D771E92|nr:polynucleotide 5'-hydroxyl-kinase NOL9-like [Phragmites australis]XP_062207455.1 polynucleotide 5'-hydroxyl-kinase NOL9-like [Phragmites australis]
MAGARATPTPPSPAPRAEVVVPTDWASAISLASSHPTPPVVVVCGPKNSGKSTFSRLLLNALLPRYGRVGYLDTDVGQPEFAPPGCLAFHVVDEAIADLLNPTLREAERCCFFGDISSKRDPEAYLNCLFHLYNYFVEKYRRDVNEMLLPLIVNTPGWVKGAGFDMLVEMLRCICPTIVVQIRITTQSKNLPDGMFWLDGGQTGPKMINVNAAFRDASNRSLLIQKDSCGMRERRLVEYLKQCFPTNISLTTNKELAYALASLPPYQVPFSDVTVMHLHCEVPAGEIWHSLNATIVGLAVSNASEATGSIPCCVGLGIVRGVDVQKGLLYVITPVPLQRLQSVDLLLQGLIEIPTSLLQVRGCVSPYMSTNVLHKISERDLYAE